MRHRKQSAFRPGSYRRRRIVRGAAVLAAVTLLHPVAAASAAATPPTTLAGTVYLPDGSPAAAAVVQLLLADPTGAPVPGTAFVQEVTAVDGTFTLNPPERPDLVTTAEANGGDLPIAVQVGDLAPHGTIDPDADPSSARPDLALFVGSTTLSLLEQETRSASPTSFGLPSAGTDLHVTTDDVSGAVGVVLDVAGTVEDAAQVAGMFTDPDLVAGNDNVNDPDLVPPLGAIMTDVVPVPEVVTVGADDAGSQNVRPGDIGVSIDPGVGGLIPEPTKEEDRGDSCFRDAGTYWVSSRHGNNPEGTKTYAYLDTFSCTSDQDRDRDEVVYKWGGYTGGANQNWSIVRLKFRTEINDKQNYYMKHPDPAGDIHTDDTERLTWTVGFDYFAQASVSGDFYFKAKKIHGWQGDGTGRLYHVSWISGKKAGRWGEGFNNGGGVNLDVPQGSDGRKGVRNDVIVWRCYWDPAKNWAATCGDRF